MDVNTFQKQYAEGRRDFSNENWSIALLGGVIFAGCNFTNNDFSGVNFCNANFEGCTLRGAIFHFANLGGINFRNVDAMGADFRFANMGWSSLDGADLREASFGGTTFCNIDLMGPILGRNSHTFQSTIGIDTLYRTAESISTWTDRCDEVVRFFKGCGVRKQEIDNFISLSAKPSAFWDAFISYSRSDKVFVDKLYEALQVKGISCFTDDHIIVGSPINDALLNQIKEKNKLILCCSCSSLKSTWVAKEFNWATYKEGDIGQSVIIPLDLDGFILSSNDSMSGEIKRRSIVDFREWEANTDIFDRGVEKLILALTRAKPFVQRQNA